MHRQFLPHAKFSVFIASLSSASGGWDTVPRSLVLKIAPKHRTYPTYNISEARTKRISRPKVVSILLLKFIVDSHGRMLKRLKILDPTVSDIPYVLESAKIGNHR